MKNLRDKKNTCDGKNNSAKNGFGKCISKYGVHL
jgi:hypothetical protein